MTKIPLQPKDLASYNEFAINPPNVLYHYTTIAGAYKIISSKSLWLSKITYLNDVSELKLCINLFQKYVNQFIEKLNDPMKADFLKIISNQLNSFENTNICVASFCENGDILSQWRSYANHGEGIAMGFSTKNLIKCYAPGSINLWKCIYDPVMHHRIIDELVSLLCKCHDICYQSENSNTWRKTISDLVGYFCTLFLRIAPIIKNPHFKEEQEWRLITVPMKFTDNNYHIKLLDSKRALPVYELKFKSEDTHLSIIADIVIGPSRGENLTGEALGVLLCKLGYKHRRIIYSQIPYRKFT